MYLFKFEDIVERVVMTYSTKPGSVPRLLEYQQVARRAAQLLLYTISIIEVECLSFSGSFKVYDTISRLSASISRISRQNCSSKRIGRQFASSMFAEDNEF